MARRPQWLEDRLRRAVRQVLKTYTIGLLERTDSHATYGVHLGRKRYRVAVSNAWVHPPSCDCPDMRRVGDENSRGYCKHTIAVLLSQDLHRHQLIDLLL